MRKFVVVASLFVFGAGVALASSLSVPFYLDNAEAEFSGLGTPASGSAGFIGIRNNTTEDIVVEVTYFNGAGNNVTPANNTFELGAELATAFRPVATGVAGSGDNSDVPNATGGVAGAAILTWEGDPSDIQGRYQQFNNNGSAVAYLLPPGV